MDSTEPIVKNKKNRRVWKYIKRILLSILIFFLLIIGTAFVIVFFYEDAIKKLIVDQINKQLQTEIVVKQVELSLFQKFPNVSLVFTDVTAKDAITSSNKGNLLQADNIYLQFSIWDLFDKNYKIRKIEVKNALLNLLVYKDGTDNYHFWKTDSTSTDKSFSFDLQKLVFNNVSIRYKDFEANQDYSGLARDMVIKGKFGSDKYTMYVNGDLLVNYINVSGINYFPAKNSTIDLVLSVDQKTDTYTFQEGGANIGNLKFDVTGNVVYSNNNHSVNLKIKGKELKLQSFIEEIPPIYRQYIEDYKGRGEFYFTADINGSILGNDYPLVKVDFGISQGEIIHAKSDISLEDVSFIGEFTNGNDRSVKSSVLKIKNFESKLKSGKIKGDLTLKNLLQPDIELLMDVNMDLKDIQEFLKIDTISSLSGKMEMKVSFKGQVNSSGKFTTKDFIESKTSGILKISQTDFTLKKDPRKYTNINGDFEFSNNDLIIKKLTGNILSSDFMITGYFRNLLSYLFLKDQKLQIDADLTSVNTDLDELMKSESSTSDSTYSLNFSDKLDLKLDVDIGKLNFNKFKASSITGKVRLKNKQLLINPLSFKAMDGETDGLVMIDGSQTGKLLISYDGKIKKLNIKELFYEFGNFGQSSLKDENLNGLVSADVQFASVWSNSLKADLDKIYTKADIKIEKGEIVNYAPLKGLSKFLKVSDLNDVKFSTLHNQIEIKNRTISFPAMEIKSSAIDITASGEHTFDNAINYRIKLLLSDVLAQKAKKAKPENEEFGVVEDDNLGKTSLYILITGTVDNPVYKYDAKGVKAKIAVSFIQEKQTLKTMLNEEFGWFKKDTTVIKDKKNELKEKVKPKTKKEKENLKKQEEGKFIIEWDEDSIEK
jgi:hypothetical protein